MYLCSQHFVWWWLNIVWCKAICRDSEKQIWMPYMYGTGIWWVDDINIKQRLVSSHKSHNASDIYPTIHHFVTEMCTHVHISVAKWCIVGYMIGALWDLHDRSVRWDLLMPINFQHPFIAMVHIVDMIDMPLVFKRGLLEIRKFCWGNWCIEASHVLSLTKVASKSLESVALIEVEKVSLNDACLDTLRDLFAMLVWWQDFSIVPKYTLWLVKSICQGT